MKSRSSRTISRILTLTVILAMLIIAVIPVASIAAESQVQTASETSAVVTTPGKSENLRYFKEDTSFDMTNKVSAVTFEFELAGCGNIPGAQNGGVIIGNYSEDATSYINIEVRDYGRIRVRGKANGGSEWVADFDQSEADIRTNSARHYAIVLEYYAEYGDSVHLYVDGVKKATRYPTIVVPKADEYTHPFRIGGDYRNGNTNYFKGLIYSVAMYSDKRTDGEVKTDSARAKTWKNGDGLVAAYDLTKMGEAALRDYSGNGNAIVYNNGSGIQVENFGKYEIDKKLEAGIETFEAWVNLPKYYTNSIGGTIIGNYRSYNGARICLEVYVNGNPRLSYTNANGKTSYHRFTDVNLKTGSWQHLTIVHDVANGEVRCYVNGELKQTLTENVLAYSDNALDQKFLIGRDTALRYAEGDGEYWENRKDQYFKGFIKEVRLYSDVRSAEEIASDYAGSLDKSDAGLLACYQIAPENAYGNLEDVSGNGYTATYKQLLWEKEYVELADNNYSYSFAIVGDTQTVADQNPELLKNIYQWILDNQTSKNIQYVIGLGDITEYGVDVGHTNYEEARANAQWTAAKEAISLMDGKIPYSLIRGDGHDGIELFNQYFGNHAGYTQNISGYYQEGRIDNVYHTFKAGNVDYLLLCLDHGTKDDVLVWANEVVATHPNHQVIVTTHHYMKSDGTLSVRGETGNATAYDPNNNAADDLWNKFLSKHPNISMVICGHSDSDDVVITKQTGNHGNEVTQILINPQTMDAEYGQGSKGMVAMFYFSEDGAEVQVEYYSTLKDTYRPSTEFTVSTGTHTYTPVVTAPTCTEEGYTTHTCTGCDKSYVTDTTPATGHSEKTLSAVAPTCTETGLTVGKQCTVCQTVTVAQTVIDALGHTEKTLSAVAPTCTEAGLTAGKQCTACQTITVAQTTVDALGHTEKTLSAVAPTCTATGLTEGKQCTVCQTITVAQTTVNALGHTEETLSAVAPTCTETGLTEGKKCTVCGVTTVAQNTIPANGHSYNASVTAPDCENAGYTTYTCATCGDSYITDHTDALGHSYKSVVTAPTCTAGGYTTSTCSVCGDVYTSDQTPAAGHTAADAVIENKVDPDCVNSGSYDSVVYCSVCNKQLSRETKEIAALEHDNDIVVPGTAATCTAPGLTDGAKCSKCGKEMTAQTEIPAKGHTIVADPAVEATCKTDGKTAGEHCSVCDYEIEGTVVSKDTVPHTYDNDEDDECNVCGHVRDVACKHTNKETIAAVDATCTTAGSTAGEKCSDCGEILTAPTTLPATGHTEVADAAVEVTCTTAGKTAGKHCSVCNEVLVAQTEIPAKGHTETALQAVDPTCTATGLTTGKHCTVCDTDTIPQEVIPAKGHNNEAIVTAPTCTEAGYTTYTCTVCGDSYVADETFALGHTEMTLDAVAPTCTEAGLTEGKKCTVCGATTVEQTEIPTLGHTEMTLDAVAPTCTEAGLTEGKKCTVCGTITVEQTVAPALGHTEETLEAVAPTCTKNGLTEGKMCTVCGVITVNQTIVSATEHDFEDATTEAPKTCKTCGATEGEKLDASAPTDENTEETDFMSSFEEFIRLILEFLRQLFGLTEKETSGSNL